MRHCPRMGRRRQSDEQGRRAATGLRRRFGGELRQARLARGFSQRATALEAGMSKSQLGRIERGEIVALSFEQACRAAAALGLALAVSAYPDGSPVRDAGQLRLESRLRAIVHRDIGWQTEVPMPIPGDRLAWTWCSRPRGGGQAVSASSDSGTFRPWNDVSRSSSATVASTS
jgi:transcriptional regulator with XRE-family HTH domain